MAEVRAGQAEMSAEALSADVARGHEQRTEAGVAQQRGNRKASSKKRRKAAAAARAEPAPGEQRGSSESSERGVDLGDVGG